MKPKMTSSKFTDIYCKADRIQSIGKFLWWMNPDELYTNIETEAFYQNMGEIIDQEAENIKEALQRIE